MPTAAQRAEAIDTALANVPRRLFIGGEWLEPRNGGELDVVDPATAEVLLTVADADADDVDVAVAAARRALEDGPWQRLTPAERQRIVWRFGDLIEQHADELALIETLDVGKPLTAAIAADVPMAADYFRYMAGWATRLNGETVQPSLEGEWHGYTLREPVGVVAAIVPWNFPLLMATWKVAPALACGNTVVLKPAEETPMAALRLAALAREAGLPDGALNVITGAGPTAGAALASHPGIDKVSFTGSTEVGRLIVAAAKENLTRVSLELGGKSPNVVFPDADLDVAIGGASSAIFYNAGQCCTAGSRLFVHRDVFDDVLDGVARRARSIKLGHGLHPDVEMGPLVSQRQLDRVEGRVATGVAEGAGTLVGGRRSGEDGYFFEPTVLVDVTPQMSVVREEIFGPVLVAQPFQTLDEVAAAANASQHGLGAGVWTKDLAIAHRLARRIRSGAIYVNCYQPSDPAMPFGGFKQSGWGREHGAQAVELYTETKGVFVNLAG